MTRPIAAITLEYRSPRRTLDCVAALIDSGVSQVLILDNSADGGMSERTLRNALAGEDRVLIVSADGNLGFAAGVNKALGLLRDKGWIGRVLLINNDALIRPEALVELDRALDASPHAALAYPTIQHDGMPLALTYYSPCTGLLSHEAAGHGIAYVSGCCILLSQEISAPPLFDETFFMYGEDVELSARLQRRGLTAVHAPTAHVVHEGSASSGLNTLFYEMHMVAAHVILAKRLARSRLQYMIHVGGRCIFLPIRAIVRALRYRSLIPMQGLVQGWRVGRAALARKSCHPS